MATLGDKALLNYPTSSIKNKKKRREVYAKQKKLKTKNKLQKRKRAKIEAEKLGQPSQKKIAKTQDNTREKDETVVDPEDEEVQGDEAVDEFSDIIDGKVKPRVIVTSSYKPSKIMYDFIIEFLRVIPGSTYYQRKSHEIKKIVKECSEKGFTDILIVNEDSKSLNALTHIHLPYGPTAYYKLTSVKLAKDIANCGRPINAKPEVILNNFNTRLGHRVSRMLGALFGVRPDFRGRRVATFHNQRDFIFFRHHRYIFDGPDKARLQPLSPTFTLKLRWLMKGTFDTKKGEYEWIHKRREMDTSRKRFFL
mmetsp:Transcript_25/g.62  ORF Transcript_25/g.62 Transcript_25/m.62 type:complete len:308 (-) Transcript_25:97-1020(-)|eukprot:CAMPEP_0114490760 /NCGR_PEP_ID=MMETSP0109-20121206/2620_1 /TAXON_ID=29199 /ORGANISM="Chlorarachnion reptans, Strain CCCM449" /LENGTH=307 /DNA_ID=CAMNT_0001667411 /DNA_START=99 /DNA_END=1022 /DNA_ORIENTATION=+